MSSADEQFDANAQASADCSAIVCALVEVAHKDTLLAEFVSNLRPFQRLRIALECLRLTRGYVKEGVPRPEIIDRVDNHIIQDAEFNSILLLISMAALSAAVQFIVRKLLERLWPE